MFDLITVVHNEHNTNLAYNKLLPSIQKYSTQSFEFFIHDNSINNIGFGAGCNQAVKLGKNPVIGFLNPDTVILGEYMNIITSTLVDDVVITGANFNKNPVEVWNWGLHDWVCGAAMFVKRDWFELLDGFDEQYIWSHEETDFIRQTESMGKVCQSLTPEILPIAHMQGPDDPADLNYKQRWFADAESKYRLKWR